VLSHIHLLLIWTKAFSRMTITEFPSWSGQRRPVNFLFGIIVVFNQRTSCIYHIAQWSHIVNCNHHFGPFLKKLKLCDSRFFGRDSGLFKFEMHAGIAQRYPLVQAGRRLVAFTFHPTAPFAISVQRTNTEYLVNFHLRLDPSLWGKWLHAPWLLLGIPHHNISPLNNIVLHRNHRPRGYFNSYYSILINVHYGIQLTSLLDQFKNLSLWRGCSRHPILCFSD